MVTRVIEGASPEAEGISLCSIRWSAIFAGLAVGLGTNLLLMLIGVALGLAVYATGGRPEGSSIPIAAGVWNTFSMLVSALVGGYVAARASGLRRSLDGMLHGAVAWGATTLFFAILTGSVTGSAVSGAFGAASTSFSAVAGAASETALTQLLASVERGDREGAVRILRDRLGLSEEQARRATDQAMSAAGRSGGMPNRAGEVDTAVEAATAASAWLGAAILLSLIAGAGGGVLGARGARKRSQPGRYAERRSMPHQDMHIPTA